MKILSKLDEILGFFGRHKIFTGLVIVLILLVTFITSPNFYVNLWRQITSFTQVTEKGSEGAIEGAGKIKDNVQKHGLTK